MIIGAYYINRSNAVPCWTVANTRKEADRIAREWANGGHCVSVDSCGRVIYRIDSNGEVRKPVRK